MALVIVSFITKLKSKRSDLFSSFYNRISIVIDISFVYLNLQL